MYILVVCSYYGNYFRFIKNHTANHTEQNLSPNNQSYSVAILRSIHYSVCPISFGYIFKY